MVKVAFSRGLIGAIIITSVIVIAGLVYFLASDTTSQNGNNLRINGERDEPPVMSAKDEDNKGATNRNTSESDLPSPPVASDQNENDRDELERETPRNRETSTDDEHTTEQQADDEPEDDETPSNDGAVQRESITDWEELLEQVEREGEEDERFRDAMKRALERANEFPDTLAHRQYAELGRHAIRNRVRAKSERAPEDPVGLNYLMREYRSATTYQEKMMYLGGMIEFVKVDAAAKSLALG